MRRFFLFMAILMTCVVARGADKKTVIDRIEPTNWFVGLKDTSVQLMVYGKGIRDVADDGSCRS